MGKFVNSGLAVVLAATTVSSIETFPNHQSVETMAAERTDAYVGKLGSATLVLAYPRIPEVDRLPVQPDILPYHVNVDIPHDQPKDLMSDVHFDPTAGIESAVKRMNETTVSTINETVDPNKLYDIDPAKIREATIVLLDDGFTVQGAAATVGALMTESRLNPNENGGIVQWTGGRKKHVNPKLTDTLDEQLKKMIKEMEVSYGTSVYDVMHKQDASITETIMAMHRYEGEGVAGRRREFARTLLDLMNHGR